MTPQEMMGSGSRTRQKSSSPQTVIAEGGSGVEVRMNETNGGATQEQIHTQRRLMIGSRSSQHRAL